LKAGKTRNLIYLLSVIIFILGGCMPAVKEVALPPLAPTPLPSPPPPPPPLVLTPEEDIPAFQDDMDLDSLRQAALKSLRYLERLPVTESFRFGDDIYSRDEVIDSVRTLLEIINAGAAPEDFARLVKENFSFYQSSGRTGQGDVLFTGYYLPVLKGSRLRTGGYLYPLYRRPDDMLYVNLQDFGLDYPQKTLVGRPYKGRLVPYYTRREIDYQGVLQGKGLELLYLADPIEVFFLQIQGSGRIELEDGKSLFAQYQAKNGRPYRSIGNLFIEEGKMEPSEVSLFSLKDYLKKYPEEQERILCYNQSYVFFRLAEDGPRGCLGEILTPGRSIATDSQILPRGAIALIIAEKPALDNNGGIERWTSFTRLVLNQDTGGAIKGPGRVDIFWGSGPYAEAAAGNLKHTGRLFFLVKKRAGINPDTKRKEVTP